MYYIQMIPNPDYDFFVSMRLVRARWKYDASRAPVLRIEIVDIIRIFPLFHGKVVRKKIHGKYREKWREVLLRARDGK